MESNNTRLTIKAVLTCILLMKKYISSWTGIIDHDYDEYCYMQNEIMHGEHREVIPPEIFSKIQDFMETRIGDALVYGVIPDSYDLETFKGMKTAIVAGYYNPYIKTSSFTYLDAIKASEELNRFSKEMLELINGC